MTNFQTLSGKEPARAVLEKAKAEVLQLPAKLKLGIVLVGSHPPSEIYVTKKEKTAKEVGIDCEVYRLPATAKENELLELVEKLNNDKKVTGFIVQAPLPRHIEMHKLIEAISPKKDVDGFGPANMGKLMINILDDSMLACATPSGIMAILDYYKIEISGKNAVVVGRSNIVGKPIAMLLLHRNATVTVCHKETKNLKEFTKNADIIIAATGVPKLIKADMVREGAYVIDVGTTRVEEKLTGDVDFENIIKKAHCSPVPGGVGPMTVAMLISNTVKAGRMQIKS